MPRGRRAFSCCKFGFLMRARAKACDQERPKSPCDGSETAALLDRGYPHPFAPEKSRVSLHPATRIARVVPGVFRLRPTNRGSPAETTAPTAAISP
jgi:hypothetical protein